MRRPIHARPRCAFCGDFMRFWPRGAPATTCPSCRRPLLLVPISLRRRRYRIFSVLDFVKVVLLPIVGGAVVAFGAGRLSGDDFAYVVSLALGAVGLIITS